MRLSFINLTLAASLAGLLFGSGCSRHSDASPAAYEYAKALYSITNRQAADKIDDVSVQIDAAHEKGEISAREAKLLHDMLEDARSGAWKDANRAARRFMEAQIE